MRVNTKSYPHPVLGNGDDLGGFFKVEFKYELGKEEIALNPTFSLKNTAIEELLKKEKASFISEVECRGTFFRTSFSTRKQFDRFTLPSRVLRERVTIGFYICADQNLSSSRPSETHSFYEGVVFDLKAGLVLTID